MNRSGNRVASRAGRQSGNAGGPPRLQALNTPSTIHVEVGPSGHPIALRTRRGFRRVEAVLEVWRIDDEWWRRAIHRRYLSLLLEGGRPVTVFQDLMDGSWYLQEG